jgi:extracellular elastinolytic metalloproteinase
MDGDVNGNGEVHRIGEIWCSALWDMTWNIIRHEGAISPDLYNSAANGGNIIALKLVMEGMKLQPCRPGFLDARNAILAADSILFNNSHKCDIWNAFARRGMGFSAIQGSSNSTGDQMPAFDVPSGVIISRSAAPSIINAGANVSFTTTVSCQCDVPSGSFTVSDTIPAGFSFVSSNTGNVEGNVVRFNPVTFSNSLESITLGVTLRASSSGCAVSTPVNDDRESHLEGNLLPERISGSINWVSSAVHAYSGANAWYAADASSSNNITLTTGAFTPGSLSILSFWHYYVTENYLDGGKVELSADNGASWIDAKPFFLQNGYNSVLNASAPQPNTPAFTGTSYATSTPNNGRFIQSIVDLSLFAGQLVKLRFRFQTNVNNVNNQAYDGWYIDDITVTNGCGGISKMAVSNTSGDAIDSVSRPFFIMPNNALPLTLVNFSATQSGKEVLLNWETAAEVNTRNFEVERSADGISWSSIGAVPAKDLTSNAYFYSDRAPLEHKNFYRIRINDRDGVHTYTVVKKIELKETAVLTLVPNPAVDQTIVYFGLSIKGGVLMVTDLQGRVLQTHALNDNASSFVLPTGKLPSGNYMIRLQLKSGLTTRKLIVAH